MNSSRKSSKHFANGQSFCLPQKQIEIRVEYPHCRQIHETREELSVLSTKLSTFSLVNLSTFVHVWGHRSGERRPGRRRRRVPPGQLECAAQSARRPLQGTAQNRMQSYTCHEQITNSQKISAFIFLVAYPRFFILLHVCKYEFCLISQLFLLFMLFASGHLSLRTTSTRANGRARDHMAIGSI